MRTRLQNSEGKLKLDKVMKRNTNELVNLSYCFCMIYIKTQAINWYLIWLFLGLLFRYLGYLFFITPRFENKEKLCQGFQSFLYILKARLCCNSVTKKKKCQCLILLVFASFLENTRNERAQYSFSYYLITHLLFKLLYC